MSSGTDTFQEKVRDCLAGTSKAKSVTLFPRRESTRLLVRASLKVRRTAPFWIVGDWLDTLTVNSIISPSRRKRGGLGWTMMSLAVTMLSVRNPERISLS